MSAVSGATNEFASGSLPRTPHRATLADTLASAAVAHCSRLEWRAERPQEWMPSRSSMQFAGAMADSAAASRHGQARTAASATRRGEVQWGQRPPQHQRPGLLQVGEGTEAREEAAVLVPLVRGGAVPQLEAVHAPEGFLLRPPPPPARCHGVACRRSPVAEAGEDPPWKCQPAENDAFAVCSAGRLQAAG